MIPQTGLLTSYLRKRLPCLSIEGENRSAPGHPNKSQRIELFLVLHFFVKCDPHGPYSIPCRQEGHPQYPAPRMPSTNNLLYIERFCIQSKSRMCIYYFLHYCTRHSYHFLLWSILDQSAVLLVVSLSCIKILFCPLMIIYHSSLPFLSQPLLLSLIFNYS